VGSAGHEIRAACRTLAAGADGADDQAPGLPGGRGRVASDGVSPREIALADDLRALAALDAPSYTYACELAAPGADRHSAEAWARAVFEDAPAALRRLIVTGWIAGLGLRLAPRGSPEHVLGWTILSNEPRVIVLAVGSPILAARIVVRARAGDVVHATFVRYERSLARPLWLVAAPIHARVIPHLLGRAGARLAAT